MEKEVIGVVLGTLIILCLGTKSCPRFPVVIKNLRIATFSAAGLLYARSDRPYILCGMKTSPGIHHITAITGDPQKNLDFYEGFLGQKLVKQTVNFDDPRSYHFYFGDKNGTPGTLLTFFYFGKITPRTGGTGEVSKISYAVSSGSKDFWISRAQAFSVPCESAVNVFKEETLLMTDPDGIRIELVFKVGGMALDWWTEGEVPKSAMLLGFHGATLSVVSVADMQETLRELGYKQVQEVDTCFRFSTEGNAAGSFAKYLDVYEEPDLQPARQGTGAVHHIAFRARSDSDELEMRAQVTETGLRPTPVIDRQYFHSVYFMTRGGILFEIATDEPGFAVDEDIEKLGEKLVLPPHLEPHREEIQKNLVPIVVPRHRKI